MKFHHLALAVVLILVVIWATNRIPLLGNLVK